MPNLPADIRAELLVDRFSHRLGGLSRSRLESLGIPGSLEGLVWNVFGSLAKVEPRVWLPILGCACRRQAAPPGRRELERLRPSLWETVPAPPERQEDLRRRALRGQLRAGSGKMRRGRVVPLSEMRRRLATRARAGKALEPPLEVGVAVRTPRRLIYILPVLDSELEMEVECDRGRNALLRCVDAGLHVLARSCPQARIFQVILLYLDADRTPRSVELVRRYRAQPRELVRALGHRRGLKTSDVRGILGLLQWSKLARRLAAVQRRAELDPTESTVVSRLLRYLEKLGIGSGS